MINPLVYQKVEEILRGVGVPSDFVNVYYNSDMNSKREQIIQDAILYIQKLQAHMENHVLPQIEDPSTAFVLFEFAGNGDSIHTNLLIDHFLQQRVHPEHSREFVLPQIAEQIPQDKVTLSKSSKIYWVCNPLVNGLYKNETRFKTISNGMDRDNKFRFPCSFTLATYSLISDMLRHTFEQVPNKIHISERICASHFFLAMTTEGRNAALSDHYYMSMGIERDLSIKHSIEHNDDTKFYKRAPRSKYVVIEHSTSNSAHTEETLSFYSNLASFLKKEKGYKSVIVGGPKDPPVEGCVNFLGESLYNVYTLVKKSSAVISRNSGNSTLVYFFKDLPVLEIDTEYDTCTSTSRMNYKDNIHYASKESCFAKLDELL